MEAVVAALGVLAGVAGGGGVRRAVAHGAFRYAGDPPASDPRWVMPACALAGGGTAYGLADRPWVLPLIGVLASIAGCALAAVDLQVHRLPRAITWPSYPALAALLTGASWAVGDVESLRRAAYAGATNWALYYLLYLLARRRGLGRGDVTLAGLIGMLLGWFSWPALIVATYLTFLLAGCWAAALLVTRRATRTTRIAFGPFMIAAALTLLAAQ